MRYYVSQPNRSLVGQKSRPDFKVNASLSAKEDIRDLLDRVIGGQNKVNN